MTMLMPTMADSSVAAVYRPPDQSLPVASMYEYKTLQVNGAHYLATPLPILCNTAQNTTMLATVLSSTRDVHCHSDICSWISDSVKTWSDSDDVFQRKFLDTVIYVPLEDSRADQQMRHFLTSHMGTTSTLAMAASISSTELPDGPYLISDSKIWRVARLYDDHQQAFIMTTKPKIGPGKFENLRVSGDFYTSLSAAVLPRRIASAKQPFAGLRFAIKDMFDIEGLRVTVGNRAWFDLSHPATQTAPAIQKLIASGAQLVGTLKLGSLITREEPTESGDYMASFNPRGDGYQSAWSSSGGSGAAIASYEWLDFTIGSDTTGSSRRPAMANGCFQIRTTHGRLSLSGAVPSWGLFDSLAMFTRDINLLQTLAASWLSVERDLQYRRPLHVIYPLDFWPVDNAAQMSLVENFLVDLAASNNVEVERMSIAELWSQTKPPEARGGQGVRQYLDGVGGPAYFYAVYHAYASFREQYHARYGKEPYVNAVLRWRWDYGRNVSTAQYQDAVNKLHVYKTWFLQHVLQVGKRHTLVVLPITAQQPDYRDVAPGPPSAPDAFDGIWLAPILGAPEVSIPLGEMAYESKVSLRKEYLPVAVSLLGEPDLDIELINAARHALEHAKRPMSVAVGSRLFGIE